METSYQSLFVTQSFNLCISGSDSPSTESKEHSDSQSTPVPPPISPVRPPHNRLRTDVTLPRGDNTQSPMMHHRTTINSNTDNHHRSNSFSAANYKQPTSLHSTMSSHKGSHKGATPTQEQEKLTRTLTSLNIATFEPMLPPTLDKRSQTFIGQKRPSQLRTAQNQYTTVSIECL